MHIHRAEIVENLRARGLLARADWVDRELPRMVDTNLNSSLLRMLDIHPATMTPADIASG